MFIIVRVDEFTYWEIGLFPVKLILGVKPSRAAGAPGADIPASFKSLKAWPAEQSVGTDMWYWCVFCGAGALLGNRFWVVDVFKVPKPSDPLGRPANVSVTLQVELEQSVPGSGTVTVAPGPPPPSLVGIVVSSPVGSVPFTGSP